MKKPAVVLGLVVALLALAPGAPTLAAEQAAERAPATAGRYIRTPAPRPVNAHNADDPDKNRHEAPECRWIGHRIVLALLRDDVLAADGFQRFYDDFDCPVGYLAEVFGCAVPRAGDEVPILQQHVALCWQDPGYAAAATGDADGTAAGVGKAKPGAPKAPADGKPTTSEPAKPATTYPK